MNYTKARVAALIKAEIIPWWGLYESCDEEKASEIEAQLMEATDLVFEMFSELLHEGDRKTAIAKANLTFTELVDRLMEARNIIEELERKCN